MKTEQLVLITSDHDKINEKITAGWRVVSITAQTVATGINSVENGKPVGIQGKFCFLFEK